jgi:transcriptional regulator GlxA family with amidase domain
LRIPADPLSGFVDMLRLASDAGDKSRPTRCVWEIIGENLNPVRASCRVTMPPWRTFLTASDFDYLVVIGGRLRSGSEASSATLDFLRRAAEANKTLVGLCTAAFAFALERFPTIPAGFGGRGPPLH